MDPHLQPFPGPHPTPVPYDPGVIEPWEPESRSPAIDFREIAAAARRNLWIVVLAGALGTAMGYIIASKEAPRYRARATLRLEDARRALAGQFDANYVDWVVWRTDPLVTETVVLKENREVAGAVVDREGLRLRILGDGLSWGALRDITVADDATVDSLSVRFAADSVVLWGGGESDVAAYGEPVEVGGVWFTVDERPNVARADFEVVSRDKAISTVLGSVSASVRKSTNLIDLEYTADDPVLAQRVVNAVAEEFQAYNLRRHQQISVQRRAFIEGQIDQMNALLNEAYRALSTFRRDRQLCGASHDLAARHSYINELQLRREDLLAKRTAAESLIARYESTGLSQEWLWSLAAAPGIGENPVISDLYGQINAYMSQREQMTAGEWGSWPEHPDVQRVTTLISAADGRLLDALRIHVEGLDAQIAALEELNARSAAAIETLSDAEMEETWLVHEVEGIRSIMEQLRGEYQRARISEAVEMPQYGLMSLATTPGRSLGTRQKQTIVLGLVIGLVLGSGGAVARETLNSALRRREEIEAVFGVPGLAVIPRINPPQTRRWLVGRRSKSASSAVARTDLVTTSDYLSNAAEAYRLLRTNLIFSHAVQRLDSILITSPSAAEGKTTTAANLAVTVAQQGMRVVLIDCDLRRPRLHSVFGLAKQPGLTEFLIHRNTLAEVVHETFVPNLFLIPAGAMPPNPGDLLGIERMRQLIAKLGELVDLVILDSPPILAASDSTILGLQVDGALLVARAGKTERGTAQVAMQQLSKAGVRVVGVVINDPDQKVSEYYYYYDYDGEYARPPRRAGAVS